MEVATTNNNNNDKMDSTKISRIFSLGFLGCKHSVPAWLISGAVHFTWIWSLISLLDMAGPDNKPFFHLIWACGWVASSLALLLFIYQPSIKWAHVLFSRVNIESRSVKQASKFARAGIADKFFGVTVGLLGLLYLILAAIQYGSPGPVGAGGADGGNHVLSALSGLANQTTVAPSVFQVRRFVAAKSVDLVGFLFSAIALIIFYIPWYQVSLMSSAAAITAGITSATPLNAGAHEMTRLEVRSDSVSASGGGGANAFRLNAALKTRV